MLNDCLGICFYLTLTLLPEGQLVPEALAKAYRAATGLRLNGKDLMVRAERAYQVERAINALMGMQKQNDTFTRRPEPDSWARGIDMDNPGMLGEYYRYRGLSQAGLPAAQRLHELGLQEVAAKLERHEKLARLDHSPILSMDTIIRNPADEIESKGILNRIRKKMMGRKMKWMADNPENLRRHFSNFSGVKRVDN